MFTQEIFLSFFIFVIGSVFAKTLKKLNPFIMLFGLIVFAPVILSILGWEKWYYTASLVAGVLFVFGNPFKFVGYIWTELTMGFQLQKAERQARREQEQGFEHAEDEIHRQEREAEERLNQQKADIEDELHRQRAEAEEEIRRQAEELRRREEYLKQEQVKAYRERVKEQKKAKKTVLDPTRLSDACEILGLAQGLSIGEYTKAWKGLVQQYHPDKTAHLGVELRKLAHEKTQMFNRALETIKRSSKK